MACGGSEHIRDEWRPWLSAAPAPARAISADLPSPALRSIAYVAQTAPNECGLACLATIAAHHDLFADLAMLRRLCKLSERGATLKALMGAAAQISLKSRALKGRPQDHLPGGRQGGEGDHGEVRQGSL